MISTNDIKFFKVAQNISKLSNFKKVKIGCVVVYKNNIISTGYNSNKSHPVQKQYNIYRFHEDNNHKLHAETKSLLHVKDLNINWGKVKIYVYREFRNGKPAMSRPCKSCMKLIRDIGIKNIYYTSNEGYVYEKIVY